LDAGRDLDEVEVQDWMMSRASDLAPARRELREHNVGKIPVLDGARWRRGSDRGVIWSVPSRLARSGQPGR
jgi:hypothetical protein